MKTAGSASMSCRVDSRALVGLLRVSRVNMRTGSPATPPAWLAASMAISSARSELMLSAAR